MFSYDFLIQMVALVVVLELLAAVTFECIHWRWVGVDYGRSLPSVRERTRLPLYSMFSGMFGLIQPYFCCPEGSVGRFCSVVIFCASLVHLFLSYVHNMWQKRFWDLFNLLQKDKFGVIMLQFFVLVTCSMLTHVYLGYHKAWLGVHWREIMTKQLTKRWLNSRAYYFIQLGAGGKAVDNPDQRIQEDVPKFVGSAVRIVPSFADSVGKLFVFAPIVLAHEPSLAFGMYKVPGWLLMLAFVYAMFGSIVSHVIGWQLVPIEYAQQVYEADFRRDALHVRNHAEGVALYASESCESEHLGARFENIKLAFWRHTVVEKRLSFFTSVFGFVEWLMPFFLLAPSYFNKEISLGDLFQLTGAVGNVMGSLTWFLNVYDSLVDWRATTDRLLDFENAIVQAHEHARQVESAYMVSPKCKTGNSESKPDACVKASIAEIRLPSDEVLWKHVCFEVAPGQRVLISGPEGIGKSLLFKTLAGVWPHVTSGNVQIAAENPKAVLFVPQQPLFPPECTLSQALAYPDHVSHYEPEALKRALCDTGLHHLLDESMACTNASFAAEAWQLQKRGEDKLGIGLDRVADWSMFLSPGQKQRFAVAHVLFGSQVFCFWTR